MCDLTVPHGVNRLPKHDEGGTFCGDVTCRLASAADVEREAEAQPRTVFGWTESEAVEKELAMCSPKNGKIRAKWQVST